MQEKSFMDFSAQKIWKIFLCSMKMSCYVKELDIKKSIKKHFKSSFIMGSWSNLVMTRGLGPLNLDSNSSDPIHIQNENWNNVR